MKMATAEISAIERLRCGTDGEGIRTLIGFSGCPLRCKYCPNKFTYDGSHKPKEYTVSELIEKVKIDKIYFAATRGGITFGGGEPLLHEKFIEEFKTGIAIRRYPYEVMKQRILVTEKSGQFELPLTDEQITNLVVKECKERTGRNPKNGDPAIIPKHKTVKFQVSEMFKDSLNV